MACTYRRTIVINKSSAGNLTDYPEMITINTSLLIADGKMQTDGDDIMFRDADLNLLKHWVMPGTINTATTRIFVKVPTITGSGNTTIYMYYGDAAATNIEDGLNVFTFFDDFPTGGSSSLNATRWPTITGTWTEENGPPIHAQHTGTGADKRALSNVGLARPLRLLCRISNSAIETSTHGTGIGVLLGGTKWLRWYEYNDGTRKIIVYNSADGLVATANYNWTNNTYYTMMAILTTSVITIYYDYVTNAALEVHGNDSDSGTGLLEMQGYWSGCVANYDYVAMAQYNADVSNVIGSEVSAPVMFVKIGSIWRAIR